MVTSAARAQHMTIKWYRAVIADLDSRFGTAASDGSSQQQRRRLVLDVGVGTATALVQALDPDLETRSRYSFVIPCVLSTRCR
jgi:hypothetical protein